MRDYKIIQREQKDEENYLYNEWVEKNEPLILEAYCEQIDIDDIPEEFILKMYETYSEVGKDEL